MRVLGRTSRCRAVWDCIVAVNEQAWEPMPGMVKLRCEMCELWYARPADELGERCPDCALSFGR